MQVAGRLAADEGHVLAASRRQLALAFALRHPVATVFLVAMIARTVVVAAIAMRNGGYLFDDDHQYIALAGDVVRGRTAAWDDYTRGLFHSNLTFLLPLTALFELFGVHAVLGQLLVATLGAAAAALTARIVLEMATPAWAIAGGSVVALLPSQVLFSSVTLKDAFVWAGLSGVALIAALAGRSHGRRLFALAVAAGAALVLLGYLRQHTLVVAAWTLVLTTWTGDRVDRGKRTAGALALALLVPVIAGAGVGGRGLASKTGSLSEQRALGAQGAATAIVSPAPDPGLAAGSTPTPAPTVGPIGGPTPAPSVSPEGSTASGQDGSSGGQGNLRYLPRGLSVMVLYPYPWRSGSNGRVRLARAESLVWYPLLLLALLGVATRLRRHARVLTYPLVLAGGTATMWALVEGNFGTAYRHRGEFVWAVVVLATAGVVAVAEALSRRGALDRVQP